MQKALLTLCTLLQYPQWDSHGVGDQDVKFWAAHVRELLFSVLLKSVVDDLQIAISLEFEGGEGVEISVLPWLFHWEITTDNCSALRGNLHCPHISHRNSGDNYAISRAMAIQLEEKDCLSNIRASDWPTVSSGSQINTSVRFKMEM